MCGIQIGSEQLKSILAHGVQSEKSSQAACGLQVGFEELASILAHSAKSAEISGASAACGIQVGLTADEALADKPGS